MRYGKAYIAINPNLRSRIATTSDTGRPLMELGIGRDYEVVDLLSFSDALHHMKRGYGCSRIGFTQRGPKWIAVRAGDDATLSHLELVYHTSYPGAFAGKSVPWSPDRCSLFENDWFIHPLAPFPTAGSGFLQ